MRIVSLRLILVVAMLLAGGTIAQGQQPTKVPRIGYLSLLDPAGESTRSEAIRLALRERGYIDGQNIAIAYRYAQGKPDRFPKLVAELVRLKVDIILAVGGVRAVQAAKNASKTIPIVMTGGGDDPIEAGLIGSLARPGGNVTGFTLLSRDLSGKRLELFKEAIPKLVPLGRKVLNDAVDTTMQRPHAHILDFKNAPNSEILSLPETYSEWQKRLADKSPDPQDTAYTPYRAGQRFTVTSISFYIILITVILTSLTTSIRIPQTQDARLICLFQVLLISIGGSRKEVPLPLAFATNF